MSVDDHCRQKSGGKKQSEVHCVYALIQHLVGAEGLNGKVKWGKSILPRIISLQDS